jgi:hypothetical protein
MAGLNALYKIQQKSENLKKIIYLFPNRFVLIQINCPKDKLEIYKCEQYYKELIKQFCYLQN